MFNDENEADNKETGDNKETADNKETGDVLQDHPLLKSSKPKSESKDAIKVPKGHSGFVKVEFLRKWGGRKPGENEVYHVSTAKSLVSHKAVKVIKHIKKYVPKKAKS